MEPKDNGSNLDYGFAFNDINFSDRVLRIEIEHLDKIDSLPKRKRKTKEHCELLYDIEVKSIHCNIEVKSIHISSPILAAKSPFFLKLFSNGMKESTERIATLRIHSSEEAALIDLLIFMYSNTLSSAKTSSLVDVLMVADKFQVSSCIKYCIKLLCDLPMTYELALQYLHLPSNVTMPDEVQPLTDAAKKHLADCYKDFSKFEDELINLPLTEIEAILSSDDLQVTSEDVVYRFVLKWATKHYPTIKKRREILSKQLCSLIRFKYMTVRNLKQMLTCNDFDPVYASKVVNEALLFKAEFNDLHTFHASRVYKKRPIKVLQSKFPHPHCIVYLDLKREEFDHFGPNKSVYSESFLLGGKWFHLYVHHKPNPSDSFGFFVRLNSNQPDSCSVTCEFLARSKPREEFVRKGKTINTLSAGQSAGSSNLFGVAWSQFIVPDSIYFINEVLYLKAEIAMKS